MAQNNKHNKIYKKWLLYAEADLEVAKTAYRSAIRREKVSWAVFMIVIWHCQQAVEKMLKMIIVMKGKELPYIHDLVRLREIAELENLPEVWKDFLGKLSKYYIKPRYSDMPFKKPYPKADKQRAKQYLDTSMEVCVWLKEYATRLG